jgi:hypothetical protein
MKKRITLLLPHILDYRLYAFSVDHKTHSSHTNSILPVAEPLIYALRFMSVKIQD